MDNQLVKYHLITFTLTIDSKQTQTNNRRNEKNQKKRGFLLEMKFDCFYSLSKKNGRLNCCIFLLYLDPSGLTGLEPAASALTGRCSDQLNYNPREITYKNIQYTYYYDFIQILSVWICLLARAAWITNSLFIISKSIGDNQSFNEKVLFFSLLFSLDFTLPHLDMNLDH